MKSKRGQWHDPAALKRRLEREVEPRQRLDRRQTRHLQCSLDPAAFANGEFLGKQGLNRLDRCGLTALKLLDDLIQRLAAVPVAPPCCVQPAISRRTAFPLDLVDQI